MTETFIVPTITGGREIRVIEKDGDTWMPCKDLGIALGLDRSTLYHHVQRNRDFFGETAIGGDKLSPDEGDLWVNEQGLYLLLARISVGRIAPAAKAAVIQFRKDIPVFLQQYRKKEIVQVQPQELDEVVAYDLREAKQIAELTGTDPLAMQAAILDKHGYPELAEVLTRQLSTLSPRAPSQPGIWMTPTDIGKECGLSARQVNSWLYNHDFQYPDGTVWRLTIRGEAHGEEYPYTSPYAHTEIRIRWNRSVLVASGLKRPIPESQTALPAHA